MDVITGLSLRNSQACDHRTPWTELIFPRRAILKMKKYVVKPRKYQIIFNVQGIESYIELYSVHGLQQRVSLKILKSRK